MPKLPAYALLLAASLPIPALADDATAAKAMDELLATHHQADAPGCAAGVYRGATLLHAGGFGMANLELQVPITPASAFDIGSTSKQFTAASALLLARQGKLSLDHDIRRYVPELPAYAASITLRQLLHHTSGVRDYIDLLRMSGAHVDDVATARDAIKLLSLQQATHFSPGERHQYSNSGYFLIALAIERASGQSMREFARRHVFQPLGMPHSVYRDDHAELVPHRAMAYAKDERKGWRLDVSNWEQMGDGGIVTTVQELAKWNGNFYAPTVGDGSLLRELQQRGTLNDGTRINYALGLMHGTYKGHSTVHHGGSWGGYIANLVRYPAHKLGVAVLCNSEDQPLNELVEQIADLYLPAVETAASLDISSSPTSATAGHERLQEWVGTYRPPHGADVANFRMNKGALEAEVAGTTYPLQVVSERTLKVLNVPVDVELRLEPAGPGRAKRIHQKINGTDDRMFIAFEPARSTPAQLQRLAGVYQCPEVQAEYQVNVTGTDLALITPRGDALTLAPREAGNFVGGRLLLNFPDGQGERPSTLYLGTARAQGLRCTRRLE